MRHNKYEINIDVLELFNELPTVRDQKNFLYDAFVDMEMEDRCDFLSSAVEDIGTVQQIDLINDIFDDLCSNAQSDAIENLVDKLDYKQIEILKEYLDNK